MDDANELLRRCQRGDEAALRSLMQQFSGRVHRLAFRVLGDAGRAEDASADVFVKLWSTARQWRGDAHAGTWIYRVAFHTILDHRRRTQRTWVTPPENLQDPRPGPLERVDRVEKLENSSRKLNDAMSQLTEADRAVVHLYYFEELKLAEIAAIVGSNREAIKTRLARARQRLRELLGESEELA